MPTVQKPASTRPRPVWIAPVSLSGACSAALAPCADLPRRNHSSGRQALELGFDADAPTKFATRARVGEPTDHEEVARDGAKPLVSVEQGERRVLRRDHLNSTGERSDLDRLHAWSAGSAIQPITWVRFCVRAVKTTDHGRASATLTSAIARSKSDDALVARCRDTIEAGDEDARCGAHCDRAQEVVKIRRQTKVLREGRPVGPVRPEALANRLRQNALSASSRTVQRCQLAHRRSVQGLGGLITLPP